MIRKLWAALFAAILAMSLIPMAAHAAEYNPNLPLHCEGHNVPASEGGFKDQKVVDGDGITTQTISVLDTRTGESIYVIVTIDGPNVTLTPVDSSLVLVDAAWCIKAGPYASEGSGFPITTPHLNDGLKVPNVSYVVIRSVTTAPPPAEDVCYGDGETAWAGDPTNSYNTDGQGQWGLWTPNEPGTVTIYAGNPKNNPTDKVAGTATLSDVVDGEVTITIDLAGWALDPAANESVKIQGYEAAPSGNPAPGQFSTYKGTALEVTVPAANFYGIHLDVVKIVACVA